MSLRAKVPAILRYIEQNESKIRDNNTIFNILEGDVLSEVHKAIDNQLSGESATVSKQRALPINILRKVVDKLSSLYSDGPLRTTKNDLDQELLDYYVKKLSLNEKFTTVNEAFNAYKYGSEEIFYDEATKAIKTRTMPNDMLLPYGDDTNDPLKMTVQIKFMGSSIFRKCNKSDDFGNANNGSWNPLI